MTYRLQIRVTDHCFWMQERWKKLVIQRTDRFRMITPAPQTLLSAGNRLSDRCNNTGKGSPSNRCRLSGSHLATVAVCLRWGSYFAVLADKEIHEWTPLFQEEVPGIRDTEMARMNIEISSAFCQWLILIHTDPSRFRKLVKAVLKFLPPLPADHI